MDVVVVGGGKVGAHLGKMLTSKGHGVTLVEQDEARCDFLRGKLTNVRVVCGDGDEPYILDEADLRAAHAVVAATGHDEDNLVVCLLAKLEYGVPLAIARINNPANEWLFNERFGVDVPVSSTNVMYSLIESEVSMGDIVTLLRLRAEDLAIDEVTLPEDAGCVGKRLADIDLPPDTQIMVLIRDGKVVPPRGDTALLAGDNLLILSHTAAESALRAALGVHNEPKP
jgi:trk system potassium uptake protein TrkA